MAFAELHAWMLKHSPLATPKSALGAALAYMGNWWPQLTQHTERADLSIDNNCENAIRQFVIGRKARLFSDTPGSCSRQRGHLFLGTDGQAPPAGSPTPGYAGCCGFAGGQNRRSC